MRQIRVARPTVQGQDLHVLMPVDREQHPIDLCTVRGVVMARDKKTLTRELSRSPYSVVLLLLVQAVESLRAREIGMCSAHNHKSSVG